MGFRLILHKLFIFTVKTVSLSSRFDPHLGVRGHGDRVVTLSPPTSEAGVRYPTWPQVGKLVVARRWSALYSTEP